MWGSEGIAPPFLASVLDRGKWSASRPARFTPGETAPILNNAQHLIFIEVHFNIIFMSLYVS
jgi:hypothetical protein